MDKEDRILNLIGKMYKEFSGRFDDVDNRLENVENEVKKNREAIEVNRKAIESNREAITDMENTMSEKFGALFDGHQLHNEKLNRPEENVGNINETLKKQDLKIKSVGGVNEDDLTGDYGND